jgi:hypothetical protein
MNNQNMKLITIFLMDNKLMKYSFLTLFIFIIFSTIARSNTENVLDILLSKAKEKCTDIGFKLGTEKYADCVMRLLPTEEEGAGKQIIKTLKEVKREDQDKQNKVDEKANNYLIFNEATYVGEVKKGKAHGIGVFTFSDGSTYEGKVSKNKIKGEGKYTDSQGNVYEGKFKNGTLRIKREKLIREIIRLNLKTGIQNYYEMRGHDGAYHLWFRAVKNMKDGTYNFTPRGLRELQNVLKSLAAGGDSEKGGSDC